MTEDPKADLRRRALELRDSLPRTASGPLAQHLAQFLADYLAAASAPIIGGYWPIGSELDPRPALRRLRGQGARLALPETTPAKTPLRFRLWSEGETLLEGRYGTSHPSGAAVTPDLLLVPLLAFDHRGHRLGYGGGYYDRTLAAWPHAYAIGCAYAAQQVDEIPAGPYDAKMHAIATEHGVFLPAPPQG
jgi:5-formyltetrahydrofolate cyclo-ligase